MANFTIKNIPDTLYQDLKHQATLHNRSLNREIIENLTQVVRVHKLDVKKIIKEARLMRTKSAKHPLTEKILKAAKNQGRS